MGIHRFFFRAIAATATILLLAASIVLAAQTSAQTTEKSATGSGSQDPFQPATDKADGEPSSKDGAKSAEKQKVEPEFIRKTDEQWRKILHPYVFMVTREKATEPAFSGRYATGHFRGTFVCACCAPPTPIRPCSARNTNSIPGRAGRASGGPSPRSP